MSDWIPVSERLPDSRIGKEVICCVIDDLNRKSVEIMYFHKGVFSSPWMQFDDEVYHGKVTHWMPLPEPPETAND